MSSIFSGAGHIQTGRLGLPTSNYPVPEINDHIKVYEVFTTYRKRLVKNFKGEFIVTGITNDLIVCNRIAKDFSYTVSFNIKEFRCGMLRYTEVSQEDTDQLVSKEA